jgi:hypothetical protein
MKVPFKNIIGVVLAGTLLAEASAFAGVAHAQTDPQGYFDNYPGTVAVEYNGTPQPVSVDPLKKAFDSQWGALRGPACQQLQQAIPHNNWSCNLAATGELRAKQLSPSSIGLKYVVTGNQINMSLGGFTDPGVEVAFDAELDVTLNVAPGVDGAVPSSAGDYAGQPVTIGAATVHLENVNISTDNILGNILDEITGDIGQAENQLDQVSADVTGQIAPATGALNGRLHDGAAALGASIRAGDPASNAFFNLSVTAQPTQLVVNYYRSFAPPAKPQCDGIFGDSPGAPVYPDTYCNTPPATDTLGFQRQQADGSWAAEPTVATFLSNSNFGTKVLDQHGLTQPGTYTYRVCATNIYGQACTDPQALVPNLNPSSGGGGAAPPPGQMPGPHNKPALQ